MALDINDRPEYNRQYRFRMVLQGILERYSGIINSGIDGNEDIIKARRLFLTNFISFTSFAGMAVFGIFLIIIHLLPAAMICFLCSAINATAYQFTARKRHSLGYGIQCLGNLLCYSSFYVLYGRLSGASLLIILWLIATVSLFERPKTYIPIFVLGMITFLGLEYYCSNYDPLLNVPVILNKLYYGIALICLMYLLVLIEFFKNVNSAYQKSLEVKNEKLLTYYTAIEQTYATIVITDIHGNIEYANPQFENTTGYSVQEVTGKNPRILRSDKTQKEVYENLWNTIKNKGVWKGEFINIKKDKTEYVEKAIISPIINSSGKIINFIAIKEDITELKMAEQALKESQRKYELIAENSSDVIWTLDANTRKYTYISPSIRTLRGLSVEEAMNETLEQSLCPESYERVMNKLSQRQKNPSGTSGSNNLSIDEFRQPCKDGRIIDVEINTNPLFDENGIFKAVLGVSRDISKRKQIEHALLESEAELAKILDKQTQRNEKLSNQLYYIFNNTTIAIAFFYIQQNSIKISSCNNLWANLFGYSPEVMAEKELTRFCDAETLALYQDFIFRANQSGEPVQEYYKWRNRDLYVNIFPVKDLIIEQESYFAGFVYDVTDKLQAELKVRESEEKFFKIFNSSSDILLVLDTDLLVIETNKRANQLLGYSLPEGDYYMNLGEVYRLVPEKYHDELHRMIEHFRQGKSVSTFECEIRHKDGFLLPVEITCSAFTLNNKPMILCIIRDISIRRNMERTLTQVGIQIESRERKKLAADLHDNVGPLLSSMNMCLSALTRKPGLHQHMEAVKDIQIILKEAIVSVREISNNLSPQVLISYGLASALELFFETKKQLIQVKINNSIGEFRFAEMKEIMIYNIIKEAFNNSIKYAEATLIELNISRNDVLIFVKYSDNGKGFDLEGKFESGIKNLGLFSILNRIKILEGGYKMISAPDNGFLLEVVFPINTE
jgi:PAS domain S-box-containing protein